MTLSAVQTGRQRGGDVGEWGHEGERQLIGCLLANLPAHMNKNRDIQICLWQMAKRGGFYNIGFAAGKQSTRFLTHMNKQSIHRYGLAEAKGFVCFLMTQSITKLSWQVILRQINAGRFNRRRGLRGGGAMTGILSPFFFFFFFFTGSLLYALLYFCRPVFNNRSLQEQFIPTKSKRSQYKFTDIAFTHRLLYSVLSFLFFSFLNLIFKKTWQYKKALHLKLSLPLFGKPEFKNH